MTGENCEDTNNVDPKIANPFMYFDYEVDGVLGGTPLHVAYFNGHLDVVLEMINSGTDVNAAQDNGCTTLHLASADGHMDIVTALIGAGADVNATEDEDVGQTPLHFASDYGYANIAIALINAGADVNAKDNDGDTPLYYALRNRHTEVAKVLREAGAVS